MSRWRRAGAAGFGLLLAISIGAHAQSVTLQISGLKADSIPPAPNLLVTGFPVSPDAGPYSVSVALSLEPEFRQPFFTLTENSQSATFRLDSLLTEHTVIYLRAQLIDRFQNVIAQTSQVRPVQGWLQLLEPQQSPQVNLNTRQPVFRWASPAITFLWEYQVTVINTATGAPQTSPRISSTFYTFPQALEANTSYSWRVTARALNNRGNGAVTVSSVGTFSISSEDQPIATVIYQNFPNPFGRGERSPFTCFWVDLARASRIELAIYDIRLRKVRRILPRPGADPLRPAGIYGRPAATDLLCDPQFSWDGRDDDGRFVPPGVYVVEFRGDGVRSTRKMLYKGP
ncbi:MAG TPA: hypothetical protein VIP11_00205 [Gemmatimonadaceae bacterium]